MPVPPTGQHLISMLAFSWWASRERSFPMPILFSTTKNIAGRRGGPFGDNTTGAGEGDDEEISVNLSKVDANIQRIVVTVTIHEAESRKQNFGMVRNAYMRVVNKDTNTEIARFDLSEDYSTETAMIFGEIYRYGSEWKFKAVGQGFAGGLKALATDFGVNVG